MSIGPFSTYVQPGVYTRTITEANISNVVAGLRIPVYVGVGLEELPNYDFELVRGSSASIDQQIVNEDPTQEFVLNDSNPANIILGPTDGTKNTIRVRNFPIVDGEGFGRVTNNAQYVTVLVNGLPVALASIQGAKGYITFQVPPQPTDVIRVTYYFHRGDTSFTDDVSTQVTQTPAYLVTPGVEPFVFTTTTNTFVLVVNSGTYTVTFAAGSYTAQACKTQIDSFAIPGLTTSVFADNLGINHVQLNAQQSIAIGTGTANGVFGFGGGETTSRNAAFRVYNIPITDGTGGGITTTDPTKVVATVNGTQVVVSAVDGKNGLITLPYPPAPGSIVKLTYYANTWQNTFDYLPNSLVTDVIRCGIVAGRNDYIEGTDFVISNPDPSTSIIHWGASDVVSATSTSAGATPFNDSQIITSLVDDKIFLAPCTRVVNTTTIPATESTNQFVLPYVPTLGNGRDTPLGQALYTAVANSRYALATTRPDLITVRVGRTLADAMTKAAVPVVAVDPTTRIITLQSPVPPDYQAFATFWYNLLQDDTYTFTCAVPGPVGTGQYTVYSANYATNLMQVRFGIKGSDLAAVVQWPRGAEKVPDAFTYGGAPVSETVTITFSQAPAANASYTIKGQAPYSFYSGTSSSWNTNVNGSSAATNLVTAAVGYMVGAHVTPIQTGTHAGTINIVSGANNLQIAINGIAIDVGTPGAGITLTPGYTTPQLIVDQINAAIDAISPFHATPPNHLAGFKQIGTSTGDVLFYIKSYTAPAALPAGFDSVSTVAINEGTVENVLGFTALTQVSGTPGSINKPATYVGTQAEPFNITTGLNDTLSFNLNGVVYTVTLPVGTTVAASAIVAAINGVPGLTNVAYTTPTGIHAGAVRLTSPVNTAISAITILNGNANSVLGYNSQDYVGQAQVTAQEVVNSLNSTTAFASGAIAYVSAIDGQKYVTIESLTTGSLTSSIAFLTSNAFNRTTGTNVTPGTDGDIGEDAYDRYQVTSNNPLGSNGWGVPGQTYTDNRTGLRFTVLPSLTGSYGSGANCYFTMDVSPTFYVNPSIPFYAVPGLETLVTNTVGVAINDTGTVQTFNSSGIEPNVGDFYFISYDYMKQDFSTRIFLQFKTIEANYGAVTASNSLSLAAYLAILNGAVLVGLSQVLKVSGTSQASDQSYITAIQNLATPLSGNVKPDIICPLSTSTAVYAYLTQHCEVMSNQRNQSERMGFIGFASGTTPVAAQTIAKSLLSSRIIAVYPDTAVITLTDELGNSYQSAIDGTFLAAAVAGAVVSPAVDVATPYTRRQIQGFTNLPRIMDVVEANQTATAGVTVIDNLGTILRIRQGLTTNMQSILTRLPTVTQIADYVQQQTRDLLDAFIGTKFLATRTNEVTVTLTGLFKSLIQAEIVASFTGISAAVDATDVSTMQVTAYYAPIFPLLFVLVTFNVRSSTA